MKLSFQCNLDPTSLPTKNGIKFCQNCQKHVHDIRRKSQEKIRAFYHNNPHACVIAYEHQIDRLPKPKIVPSSTNYMPYAAGIIAVSLLPALTMAQTRATANVQMIGTTPMPILNQQMSNDINQQEKENKISEKYFIEGKVTITDKKLKSRKGKEILIYRVLRDAQGDYLGEDTLALGTLQLNGKFKMEISKTTFGRLQIDNEDIAFNVDGFNYETVEKLSFSENVANAVITVSAKRIVVGAW